MPQLLILECEIIPSDAQLMVLPPKLHTLDLNLSELDTAEINTAMQSIGRLASLVVLTLQFDSRPAGVAFL